MDRGSSFNKVKSALTAAGHQVIAYDRRGYGHANGSDVAATLSDHSDDLVGVLGGRRAVVAGHSLGADVAMLAAIRRPDLVVSLVLWEPPMPWMDWWPADTAGGAAIRQSMLGEDGGGDPGAVAEAFVRRMVGAARWEQPPPSASATNCRTRSPAGTSEWIAPTP